MRQAGLLVAAFVVTLALLGGGFFAVQTLSAPAPTPVATGTPQSTGSPTQAPTTRPTPTPSATASVRPSPTAASSPTPAATPAPTPTSTPTATPQPSASAPGSTGPTVGSPGSASASPPSVGPSGKLTVVVLGSEYSFVDLAQGGTLVRGNGGTVTITTIRTTSGQTEIDWELPPSAVPAGFTIRSLDVRLCGTGSGDFWESYGPKGGTPDENEFNAPAADGCWHYSNAPGPDTTVKALIRLASTMTITRVEYTVTVSR